LLTDETKPQPRSPRREADWFVLIVGGRRYILATLFLQPLAFQIFLQLSSQPIKMLQYAFEKTKQIFGLALSRFALQMVFLFAGLSYFGIFSAVFANLSSFFLVNLALFCLIYTMIPEKGSEAFSLLKLQFKILFIPLAVVFLSMILRDFEIGGNVLKLVLTAVSIPMTVLIVWSFGILNRGDILLLKKTFLHLVKKG